MGTDVTRETYARARLGQALQLGDRPALLIVDFTLAFTDPEFPLGSDMSTEIARTRTLLDTARAKRLPVIFTSQGFAVNGSNLGVWVQKSPLLAELVVGSRWVQIDPRLEPRDDEAVIVKQGASALFGTNVAAILVSNRVDTVVVCGATTSGCVRATVVDLLQLGWPTIVPRECVGDRAVGPHEASLIDIDAKYADVVSVDDALAYLERVSSREAAL